MSHAFVSVVIPFALANADNVDAHLDALSAMPEVREALDYAGSVHFMSLTVVRDDDTRWAFLVLEASADGSVRTALERLANTIGDRLNCILVKAGVDIGSTKLVDYLKWHHFNVAPGWFKTAGLVFTGTPGITLERRWKEEVLVAWLQTRLERPAPANEKTAYQKVERMRTEVFADPGWKWALTPEPAPFLREELQTAEALKPMLRSAFRDFLWPFVALPVFLALVVFMARPGAWQWALGSGFGLLGLEVFLGALLVWMAHRELRSAERNDAPRDAPPPVRTMTEIMRRENHAAQNHLFGVSTMKRGWLRPLTLQLALWLIGQHAATGRPGFLSGIGNIHFARWIRLPCTNKLLFYSNYGGSWEAYLEDFIAKAHQGLTGVWGNTLDFPRSRSLFYDGASDGSRFKRWARRQQQPTRFWYTAYPDATAERIRANAEIRYGLAAVRNETEARNWLARIGFALDEPAPLATDNVPTLVFGALKGLNYGALLALRFTHNIQHCKAWLQQIETEIAYGEDAPDPTELVVAFTKSGLGRLGVPDAALATFPLAFQQGMAEESRRRALGDVGDNGPQHWYWGAPGDGNRVDAIVLVYAQDAHLLDAKMLQHRQHAQTVATVFHEVIFKKLPPKHRPVVEPFEFTDGISQPIVRGTRKWVHARNSMHVLEPGEMILGYRDNLGKFPPTPSDGPRDLGLNGTFLVVRQLEQKVRDFKSFVRDEAQRLVADPRVPVGGAALVEEWLAAKMVGRWKDGTSLVRNPTQPGSRTHFPAQPDNDFLFGTEDPGGLRCPFGAHIRRANPRDSFAPGSQGQIAITNRRRIFRVGRAYEEQQNWPNPGLVFMCVNADIERQFEFLQHSWVLGPNFNGLENELDPVVGSRGENTFITIPTEKGPLRVKGMQAFVRMRGGGYFFMPGREVLSYLAGGAAPPAVPVPAPVEPDPRQVDVKARMAYS